VLQFAGIAAGTRAHVRADVDVAAVVSDVVDGLGAEARERGVAVEVRGAGAVPGVAGDADALRSAIQNVVANAVKYSASGGRVDVTLDAVSDGGIVRVRVVDRGIGIDAADLAHVCRPFYRGRRAIDAQVRGTGIGLSIVQHVVRAHGGDLRVESRPGAGTTVTIVLPAGSAADSAAEPRRVVRLRRGAADLVS
jgi:signal transduction histidine kinase